MHFFTPSFSKFIPQLIDIQQKSFSKFINQGIIKELSKRTPISNPTSHLKLMFYPKLFHLSPPQCTIKEALRRGKSYSCKLYVPSQLVNLNKKEIYFKWILFGDLPLMTERGHFILNGSPRVIINQLVRSPGIYYQQRIASDGEKTFHADLIPQRGAWLRLEVDKKGNLWARMKRASKIPLLTFLQAFGLEYDKIYNTIPFQEIHLSKNAPILLNPEKALEELSLASSIMDQSQYNSRKDKEKEGNGEIGYQFLFRKFLNPRTYDLGEIGRNRLNYKLKLPFSKTKTTITAQDILFATNYLLKCRYGTTSLDDIDHLKNRRIRGSGELLQNQFDTGLIRLEKTVREKMGRTNTLSSLLSSNKYTVLLAIQSLVTTKPLNGALREFFGSSPLSQYMDQTNPLAEITHKRRITSVGPGGVSRETAGMAIRGIHSTYYGRICPIETPEGKQAGLVNSITTYARINSQGFLETPYYKVLRGQAQKSTNITFLSAEEEEKKEVNLAPGDFKLSSFNFLPKGTLPFRKRGQMEKGLEKHVDYVAISPVQMISVATSLIPFLEHDDANRALMGSNMQRQAVPLVRPERPFVGTGLEAQVIADSGHGLQAKNPGFVEYVSGNSVILRQGNKSLLDFSSISKNNFGFHLLDSLFGIVPQKNQPDVGVFSPNEKTKPCKKTNRNFVLFKKKQEIFFDTTSTSDRGEIAYIGGSLDSKFQQKQKNVDFSVTKRKKFKTYLFLQHQENKVLQLKKAFFEKTYHKQRKQIKFTNLSCKTLSKFVTLQNKFKIYPNFFFLHSCKIKTLENDILMYFFVKKENFDINHSLDEIRKNILPHFIDVSAEHFAKQNVNSDKMNSFPFFSFKNGNSNHLGITYQSDILQNQMSGSYNDKILYLTNHRFKNQFLGYTRSVPSFIFNFAKFQFLSDVTHFADASVKIQFGNHFPKQNVKETQKKENLFFIDHFAESKDFVRQKLISKSQLKITFSSQELYNFSKNKLLPCLKKQLFVWQNVQTDILWHKYSIEKSKFNLKNSNRFLPEIEYNLLLPFYNSNPYYLHLQNKGDDKFTFLFNSLKNVNNLKKNIEPVDIFSQTSYERSEKESEQNFVFTDKLKKKKTHLSQNQITLFSETKKKELRTSKKGFLQSPYTHNQNIPTKKEFFVQQQKNEKIKYQLQNYQRSNQATCLHQYPAVAEGNWLERGDLVANCSASALGELALGKNILLAYMPWEGYNFEDAILISDRLVNEDVYTSIHIERYEISVKDTEYGVEQITADIPDIPDDLTHLSENGIAKIGSWVKEGDILVGKITPIEKELISPYQKLFYSIIEKPEPTTRDTSLRVPKGIQGRVISYEVFEEEEQISVENFDFTSQLQEEAHFSFLSKVDQPNRYNNNVLPFNSSIQSMETFGPINPGSFIYDSKLSRGNRSTHLGESKFTCAPDNKDSGLTNNVFTPLPKISINNKKETYSLHFVEQNVLDLQIKSKTPQNLISGKEIKNDLKDKFDLFKNRQKTGFLLDSKSKQRKEQENDKRLRMKVFTKKDFLINSKTEAKDVEQGTEFFQPSSHFQSRIEKRRKIKSVHLYIVEKRKIQVGDKLAGRHGNKGIVSRILSKQDMPYLPDGTSVDMVLNPLGVPSRMNVGQVFECLLGLAAGWLGDHFKITPFDEIYGSEASRSLVYLKLYQARLKTGQKWLFNPQFPGKVRIFDGRTGDRFDQAVTIGRGYILKLVHMVDEKIHARSTGPYSLVTQQPVRGRSKGGGQRVGEMEVWALEGFGAAYALQELLTVKSDDVKGRRRVFDAILKRKRIFFKTPESFKLLVRELQCLCLDVGIYVETGAFNRTKIDVMDLP